MATATQAAVAARSRTRPHNKKAVTIYFGILTPGPALPTPTEPARRSQNTHNMLDGYPDTGEDHPGTIRSRFLFLLTGIMRDSCLAECWHALEWCGVLVNRYPGALVAGEEKVAHCANTSNWKNNPYQHHRPESHNHWLHNQTLNFSSFKDCSLASGKPDCNANYFHHNVQWTCLNHFLHWI